MTDLTEKWKKGELPEGFYYVKDCENIIAEYIDGYFYNNGEPMTSFNGGVDKVLAPVPSYEEYQKLLSDQLAKNEGEEIITELEVEIKEKETQRIELMTRLNDVNNENHALEIENTKLKELLKKCRTILDYAKDFAYRDPCCICIDKINQALGEDK